MAASPIYQFYAELIDYTPRMWRRFQVTNNITMARLGYILMTLFEMEANHLFCFDVPLSENLHRRNAQPVANNTIEIFKQPSDFSSLHFEFLGNDAHSRDGGQCMEVTGVSVRFAVEHEGDEMTFTYDFIGSWNVRLVLERTITDKELPSRLLPRVLEGEGCGIVEDVGGAQNLMAVRRIFLKRSGTKYRELCEWLGSSELDLDTFDIDDMNYRLKHVPHIYMEMYEHSSKLSAHSLAILDREYKTS